MKKERSGEEHGVHERERCMCIQEGRGSAFFSDELKMKEEMKKEKKECDESERRGS